MPRNYKVKHLSIFGEITNYKETNKYVKSECEEKIYVTCFYIFIDNKYIIERIYNLYEQHIDQVIETFQLREILFSY